MSDREAAQSCGCPVVGLSPTVVVVIDLPLMERTPLDDQARRWITRASEQRLADPNARDDEQARVRAVSETHGLAA
ncbi:MAG: hypothetical protein ACK5CE_20445 [Actinomycetes bacterium]|jgi:hypothetical protein